MCFTHGLCGRSLGEYRTQRITNVTTKRLMQIESYINEKYQNKTTIVSARCSISVAQWLKKMINRVLKIQKRKGALQRSLMV